MLGPLTLGRGVQSKALELGLLGCLHATNDFVFVLLQIRWYEMPASFYVFHFGNAWEDEEGKVHVFGCQSDMIDLNAMSFHKEMGSRMTHYTVDTTTGKTSMKRVSGREGGRLGGKGEC